MKNLISIFISVFILATSIQAQELTVKIYNPPIPYYDNVEWGSDYVVSNTEPMGRPSGVYKISSSTIYVSIPDTNFSPGLDEGLTILTSTNNGMSWSKIAGISPAVIITKTKMVRSALDSVYCVFLANGTIKVLNPVSGTIGTFTNYTNIGDFDATTSSTGSIYLIIDLYINNEVRIFGSIDGGITWGGAIFLSSNAAHPAISMSATGDTAIVNYYGGPFTDTVSSIIRNVRYRESVPGTLVVAGSFSTPIPAGTPKDQFEAVRYGSNAWLFYTSGTSGSKDINCILSNDGGTTYGAPFTIGSMTGRDEFWFEAKYYSVSGGGVDIVFYSDSLQTGPPTNVSDKMYYSSASNSSSSVFSAPVQISEHPPVYSAIGFIPSLIEYYDTGGDAGAIWVGTNGTGNKLYYDRLNNLTGLTQTGIEIPSSYSLSQNFPNPFNPMTIINYQCSMYNDVSLKVFDVLGNEVSTLVNEKQSAGSYSVTFDGSNFPSGVYFYKLEAGGF
ncbi:MAG: T9SS type A sorting domain-containing protein, partial [Ignavibacteria bacterium]